MHLYITTAQKTMTSTQFLYFTSRKTQHSNNTIQYNTMHDTEHIYCTFQPGRRHLHYVNYTERSGPFILSLRKPPAVNAADK